MNSALSPPLCPQLPAAFALFCITNQDHDDPEEFHWFLQHTWLGRVTVTSLTNSNRSLRQISYPGSHSLANEGSHSNALLLPIPIEHRFRSNMIGMKGLPVGRFLVEAGQRNHRNDRIRARG